MRGLKVKIEPNDILIVEEPVEDDFLNVRKVLCLFLSFRGALIVTAEVQESSQDR